MTIPHIATFDHGTGSGFKDFLFSPETWGRLPIWRAYFWNGLKPPTRLGWWYLCVVTFWLMIEHCQHNEDCHFYLFDHILFGEILDWFLKDPLGDCICGDCVGCVLCFMVSIEIVESVLVIRGLGERFGKMLTWSRWLLIVFLVKL